RLPRSASYNRPTVVPESIQRHARENPSAPAYWTPERQWSFADVEDAARRVAQGLKSLGIGPGDRVACPTKHTADCVSIVRGANKVGAVCMRVNWRLAPPEIEYIVNNGKARLMLCDRGFTAAFQQVRAPEIKTTVITEEFSAWYGKNSPV